MTASGSEPPEPTPPAGDGGPPKPRRRTPRLKGKRIPRLPAGEPAPLSFAQERILFLGDMAAGEPLFNCPFAFWLEGPLDVGALQRVLGAIEQRHGALRTTFVSRDGATVQQTRDPGGALPELPVEDLSGAPEDQRESRALARLNELCRVPMDPARCVWECRLLRLAEDRHALFVQLHHAVFDIGSVGLLMQEIIALYEPCLRGETGPLAELPLQFGDYAAWERERMQGDRAERQMKYWRDQLAGGGEPLDLPFDRARSAGRSHRGAYRSARIPASVAAGLRDLAQQQGVTLFMVGLAAFKTLLTRYTGQTDLCVGVPFSLRSRSELEGLIGVFMNTLVMRTDLSGEPTFLDVLARVRDTALDAYSHHELPFELLVDELRPDRSRGPNALFDVMFDVPAEELDAHDVPGLGQLRLAAPWELHTGTAKTDLNVYLVPHGDEMLTTTEYSAELFDEATVDRILAHFGELLAGIVARPGEPIASLPLLPPDERGQVLEWAGAPTPYRRDATVPGLFEGQAVRRPDAIALQWSQGSMTYGELNARANRVAHRLQALGVASGALVGICALRTPELIAGILGVLKLGAAYVPLDPDYPEERLAVLLDDASPRALLVQADAGGNLPVHELPVVALDDDLSAESAENPGVGVSAEDLVYVMYTSGSTGRPKGVCVTHRNVVRLVDETDFAQFGEDEVLLHASPISFDASTLELWGALLHGGRIALYPPSKPSVEELGATIRESGTTVLWLTSQLFILMVEHRLEDLRGVRHVLSGGEVMSAPHAQRAVDGLPQARITNAYGPTENTTFTTCFDLVPGEVPRRTVPIGSPIANTRCYVLDAHAQLVPIGVPGELCVGGDGVASGYLNRPELTEERFPVDPFGDGAARMYRTGDVVRWRPDGVIEYLGRRDHQVKLRGFRIELGEIEAAVGTHPNVENVAVLCREDAPGDKRLVAYAVPRSGQTLTSEELREYARGVLPDYMVPAAWVFLDALPLTPNQKVDRKALPAPGAERQTTQAFVSPRSQLERQIAGVWAELLRVEQVGAEDNFFDLGGNSLLLARSCTSLRELLGREIAIAEMFQHPSVKALAEHLGGDAEKAPAETGAQRREKAQGRRAAASDLLATKRRGRRR